MALVAICGGILAGCGKDEPKAKPEPKPNVPPKQEEPKPNTPPKEEPKEEPKKEPETHILKAITADMIDNDGVVVLSEEITEIAADCAKYNALIKKITGKNVVKIGKQAFFMNGGLVEMDFPKLTDIGEEAFGRCRTLKVINLPELTTIEQYAFLDCISVTEISIPKIKRIGAKAFFGMNLLRKVTMGADLPSIDPSAFDSTSIGKDLFVPEASVEKYKEFALAAKFRSINDTHKIAAYDPFPSGAEVKGDVLVRVPTTTNVYNFVLDPRIRVIASRAFAGVNKMQGKFSAAGVEELGDLAFEHCSNIRSMEFPKLKQIGAEVFWACSRMEQFHAPLIEEIGAKGFYFTKALEQIYLPNIKKIGDEAFDTSGVKTLEFGDTPPEIGKKVFSQKVTIVVPNPEKYAEWVKKHNLNVHIVKKGE